MNKYLKPTNYANQLIAVVNEYLLGNLETLIAPIASKALPHPPIFFLGAPRSGSTLIIQVITDALDIGYISNRHCQWYGSPALAEQIIQPKTNRQQSDYQSNYGVTRGSYAPSECGAWWYRFFRGHPAYVTIRDVTPRKMRAFRRSIAALERSSGRPLIFKNLYASLRLEPIAYYLPEAIYVVIERDWADNAQSILKGRKDALGRYDLWWSVPPPNVDELAKLSSVKQVVGQIDSIYSLINRDIDRLGLIDRTLRIRYEDFCEDVHSTLKKFQAFMARHGAEPKSRFEVPSRFDIDRSIKVPEAMYEEMVGEVRARNRISAQVGGVDPA